MHPDIRINNHGSIVILTGVSDAGIDWLEASLDPDAQRWGVNGWVVEPRYVDDILDGAHDDGLEVA
jgi:hypothetical protein